MADELTDEQVEALSPSDAAHYRIKGRLGDGLEHGDTEATKAARAAAFGEEPEEEKDPEPEAEDGIEEPQPDEPEEE